MRHVKLDPVVGVAVCVDFVAGGFELVVMSRPPPAQVVAQNPERLERAQPCRCHCIGFFFFAHGGGIEAKVIAPVGKGGGEGGEREEEGDDDEDKDLAGAG